MEAANVYLLFDGKCRDAISFYGSCFQSEPNFTRFSDGPPEIADQAAAAPDRILHAELRSGPVVLMASDMMPGMPFYQGNNFSISIACDSNEEMDRLFLDLGQNGTVTMPLQDAFWGARFGMLIDQFGISWMLSFRKTS